MRAQRGGAQECEGWQIMKRYTHGGECRPPHLASSDRDLDKT